MENGKLLINGYRVSVLQDVKYSEMDYAMIRMPLVPVNLISTLKSGYDGKYCIMFILPQQIFFCYWGPQRVFVFVLYLLMFTILKMKNEKNIWIY